MFKKFSFVFIFIINLIAVSSANAEERKLRVVTEKGTVYEQPCPNAEGIFEAYYREDGKEYTARNRCYATVRAELGVWLPFWSEGVMMTTGLNGGLQFRVEEWFSVRLAGGFGGWVNGDNANGITWYATATARFHLLDDVLRLGLGPEIAQQHFEATHRMANYRVGGAFEAEVELFRHWTVNTHFVLGEGGVYNGDVGMRTMLNVTLGYRF